MEYTNNFGLLRYEFHVIRSSPEPYIIIFSERAARDVVFAKGRVTNGPTKLHFHSWDVDHFGERLLLPYHVKLNLEGIAHHVWFQSIAEKIVGDVAVIHHVDQASRRRIDFKLFAC
jgi:hypothetical protein